MARKRSDKWKQNIGKGVTKKTPEILEKLRQAFGLRLDIEHACMYAGIAKQTYYNWVGKSQELMDELELLRIHPILKATKAIVNALDDPNQAFKYLEKHQPEIYGAKTKLEVKMQIEETPMDAGEAIALEAYKKARDEQLKKERRALK